MSTWNYRVVSYRDGSGYGPHEVYYDDNALPWGMTQEPAKFCFDSEQDVINALKKALRDAQKRPIFREPAIWPGKAP